MLIAYVLLSLLGLLAYFVYALLVYGLLRCYLENVKNGSFLDKLLKPTMFLLLVSTFPLLLLVWVLSKLGL